MGERGLNHLPWREGRKPKFDRYKALCQTGRVENEEESSSALSEDRKRLIFSLTGGLLLASVAFPLVAFLLAYLYYFVFTHPEMLAHFMVVKIHGVHIPILRILISMMPILVTFPGFFLAIRRRRTAGKRPAPKKRSILGL
jgi:hypothetical protein